MIDYEKILSTRVKEMKPSGIRKFFDIAGKMKDVISLGVGEPDFSTPWAIRKAAIETLERRQIVYGPNRGLDRLLTAISENLMKKQGLSYNKDKEIIVTVGGSEAIDISLRSIIDPGDEVLVVEPCFVCYAPLVELIGGVAVNMKFAKSLLGANSLGVMKSLIKSYMKRGGFEIQINVTDKELLQKAKDNPEEYRDLVVRIGGYSDYFVKLSPEMKEEIIMRTTHEI